MLQTHHLSFEFIFQNTHKGKFISQRVSRNASGMHHPNLSSTQWSDLTVWEGCPSCSAVRFSVRVARRRQCLLCALPRVQGLPRVLLGTLVLVLEQMCC